MVFLFFKLVIKLLIIFLILEGILVFLNLLIICCLYDFLIGLNLDFRFCNVISKFLKDLISLGILFSFFVFGNVFISLMIDFIWLMLFNIFV